MKNRGNSYCTIPTPTPKDDPQPMSATDIAPQQQTMGAGVIPFAVSDNQVYFLFQFTFSGRKTGYLIDFGGGVGPGEDYRKAAAREFVEETETLYFSDDVSRAYRAEELVAGQIPIVEELFERSLRANPDWWCRRAPGDPPRSKQWRTFFIEFPYRDVAILNREWEADRSDRFKKRRELVWVSADELLAIYKHDPNRLWKRVRQLENAAGIVDAIRRVKQA